ncbi:hypothetical protein [Saccharomonospora halophila]|uniref:hypothetical protein n=1 Tax=Saccharomonospora halophila TaxID=129922 RepID=UPI00037E9957|nr:hypothetical protein [Saccharomonospora halophila]
MRRNSVVGRGPLVAAVLLVALAGCSREAGPIPEGQGQDPGPAALDVKLEAITGDDCFRAPGEVYPPNCEKYVTQLSTVPGTARGFTGVGPGLTEAADDLDAGVRAYRANGCAGGEGGGDACATALSDISVAVKTLRTELSALPDVATRTG